MKTDANLVFVYGSLKRGFWNNRLLSKSEFVGVCCTVRDDLLLFDGGFPYMVDPALLPAAVREQLTDCTGNVYGELWRATDRVVALLDQLEGTPTHYTRERIDVQFSPDNVAQAFGYFAANPDYLVNRPVIVPNENAVLSWEGDRRAEPKLRLIPNWPRGAEHAAD